MEVRMPVKEIMTRDVVAVDIRSSVSELVKEMLKRDVGSVIITDNDHPVGIVTERDIVKKIVSKNLRPDEVSIKDIMSTPLITIPAVENVTDAMQKMVKLKIRRLPVVENARLVGIVTDIDLMAITVDMGNIFSDLIEIQRERIPLAPKQVLRGICEECGGNVDDLVLTNGKLLCEDCRETL